MGSDAHTHTLVREMINALTVHPALTVTLIMDHNR
jgi:hypothetical protein